MVISLDIFAASTTSRNLRNSEYWSLPVVTLMYCWVIVEPPPIPPESWLITARAMPVMSKPGLEKNVRSSADSTACWTGTGTWDRSTLVRLTLSGRTVASGAPSA